MSAGDLQNIRFVPGVWVKDPTDLTAAFPYGGTQLGFHNECIVLPNQVTFEVRAEEMGNILTDVVDGGRSWVVGLQMRGWDDDMVSTLFSTSVIGSVSGKRGVKDTLGENNAGQLMSSRAVTLMHVPDDVENHECTLLYCALPLIDETAELVKQRRNESVLPLLFWAVPDTSGNIFAHQLLVDLSL